jgi:hypothetical protein
MDATAETNRCKKLLALSRPKEGQGKHFEIAKAEYLDRQTHKDSQELADVLA